MFSCFDCAPGPYSSPSRPFRTPPIAQHNVLSLLQVGPPALEPLGQAPPRGTSEPYPKRNTMCCPLLTWGFPPWNPWPTAPYFILSLHFFKKQYPLFKFLSNSLSPAQVGLPALEPLANSTGGAMYLYPSAEDSALPQDVYRRLSCPRATAGMLRVRASHGFKPVRYYGRWVEVRRREGPTLRRVGFRL